MTAGDLKYPRSDRGFMVFPVVATINIRGVDLYGTSNLKESTQCPAC